MAKLAIKGHATRVNEVIEILGRLGGSNAFGHIGNNPRAIYYIDETYKNFITCSETKKVCDCVIFTLEEFLEKFPYKVGDKVRIPDYESEIRISSMRLDGYNVQYEVVTDEVEWYSTTDLNYFNNAKNSKEEIVDTGCCSMPTKSPMYKLNIKEQKDTNKVIFDTNSQCCDISNKIIEKETMKKEISGAIVDRFICLEGYDFYDDKGNIIDTKEIIMKKKKLEYPKTYKECFNICFGGKYHIIQVVGLDGLGNNKELFENFIKLKICRDAYWKIAENWKPDITNNEGKFVIAYCYGKVYTTMTTNYNRVLVFPTEEMRDAFYENFNELIEECKELL